MTWSKELQSIISTETTKELSQGNTRLTIYFFYEAHQYILNAIAREKEIKGWKREKKLELIKSSNPKMTFLNNELFSKWPPDEISHRKDLH